MDLGGRKGSQLDMMEHTENDTRIRQKENKGGKEKQGDFQKQKTF